jgi:hypothetical protein
MRCDLLEKRLPAPMAAGPHPESEGSHRNEDSKCAEGAQSSELWWR